MKDRINIQLSQVTCAFEKVFKLELPPREKVQ